jgi:carbon-monoxide dehydrogenase small subunit
MSELFEVSLFVNGREVEGRVPAHSSLLDFLRNHNFIEVKRGCDKGDCGACTVLLNGRAVLACITPVLQVQGGRVYTVKSLGGWDNLSALQQAFVDHEALQCGFCTPGVLLAAKALLDSNPHPSRAEIREAISGNLCRCTGYQKIVDAVQAVAGGGK